MVRSRSSTATRKRQPGGGFGDNYYNTAILFAVNPEGIRLKQRVDADTLTVNGVDPAKMQ